MKKMKPGINEYNQLINGFLVEIRSNRADGRVLFHYGRLMAIGLDEFQSAEVIFNTLLIIKSASNRGEPLTPDEVEDAFVSLPDESINKQVKRGLGII